MMTVCLTVGGKDLVTYATVPPFRSAPDVILWGSRVFRFVAWNGDISGEERVNCPDDVPIYTEAFSVAVTDENTPRATLS